MSFIPPPTFRAAAFTKVNGPLEIIHINWKDPQPGQIVVKVLACGICRSDDMIKLQLIPTGLPRVPGHEIVGDVVMVHPSETLWKVGDRVGSGWHGGHCSACETCRGGDFTQCAKQTINGVNMDGGYAEYVTLRSEAAGSVPTDIDPAEAAPLFCAGVTTYNGIRHMNIHPGELVAVQGIGGLGHLAIQYCRAMGFKTVAISSSASKAALAHSLGAHAYIDTSACDPAAELQKMGGARLIAITAPFPTALKMLIGGLKPSSTMLMLALTAEDMTLPSVPLNQRRLTVRGWPVGTAKDCEETVHFTQLAGIKVHHQRYSLEDANKGYDSMMDGSAQFRAVIVPW